MNLKPRFLLLTSILLALACSGIWLVGHSVTLNIAEQWAMRQFSTQVRLEKERSLQPIIREVALARQFAESQIIRDWARDENNPQKLALALNEMESFRSNFADQSFFVALAASGRYYHNNASNEYAGNEYRYTLKADNPDDQWFYSIIAQNRDMHLNVNPDIPLQVTKLWIDVLLRDGDRILGVVGTGLDLTEYIRQISTTPEPGVHNFFIDHLGAVQVSNDLSQIDFASITKTAPEQKTIWQMFSRDDAADLQQAMARAQQTAGDVVSLRLLSDGEDHLAGVIYLPEIDWYVLTLVAFDTLMPTDAFVPVFILAGLCVLFALLAYNIAINRFILYPLSRLSTTMDDLRAGKNTTHERLHQGHDEIGRLMGHMQSMADQVQQSHDELEARVRQRTRELEEQTQTDPLTGLLNRRGMMLRLELEMERHRREGDTFGIIWLDLDDFKLVNDDFGHGTGDRALEATAAHIRASLRTYDYASRWGGDEFLILVRTDQADIIDGLGQRLCEGIRTVDVSGLPQPNHLTVSAGSCILKGDMDLNQLLACADKALYFAKGAGRNQYHPGLSCHSCPGCEHDSEPRQSD
jgi:diguanylate cyclase (GGDEF)-like protein